MNNPVTVMEGKKEDETVSKDSSAAGPGGRKKKSSWPHSVINTKAANVEAEKSGPGPKSKTERKTQLGPKSKMLKQSEPQPSLGKKIEKEKDQPKEREIVAPSDQGGAVLADWKEGCTFKCKSCDFTARLRYEE